MTREPQDDTMNWYHKLVLVGACGLALWCGVQASRPMAQARQMREQNAAIKAEIAEMEMKYAALRTKAERLETEEGKEFEARKLEFVNEHEVRLVPPP